MHQGRSLTRMTCSAAPDHEASRCRDPRERFGPPVAVEDLILRHPGTVRGHLREVRTIERPNARVVEAELADATGSVILVFFGRGLIPGLAPGVALEARGTPRLHRGRIEVINPLYELLAPPGDAEPTRQARDTRSEP
jgi:hypothetical protein